MIANTTMHTLFGGLKLGACMGSGMVAGTVVQWLADVSPAVGPDTHVPLGTAVGVGVTCLMAAMWLSRRLTQLQDGQRKLGEGQARLEEGFRGLPCHNWQVDCPPPTDHQRDTAPRKISAKYEHGHTESRPGLDTKT